ncbi:L-Aspartase-like protein [Nemania serpens]|nr:L-Aspartase-like protein [Nemania serpens]
MVSYNESIYVDRVAYKQVVLGSIAWARANHKGGILMVDKFEKMESGLRAVLKEWDEGSFKIVPGVDEDIHTANERRLGEIIGKDVAGKLHTGRSRNEQVACDMRMWLRDELREIESHLVTFSAAIYCSRASSASTACCGTRWAPWRDRDFVAETLQWGALLITHASRWAEDLIIYSTGNSLMPQKKNRDSIELSHYSGSFQKACGKSGRVIGQMAGFIVTLKGLPSTYNKDLQESWENMIGWARTVSDSVRPDRMRAALPRPLHASPPTSPTTSCVPFRETHHISGPRRRPRRADQTGTPMDELTYEQLRSIDARFGRDVAESFDYDRSVEMRSARGGTSRSSVLEQIQVLRAMLNKVN